MMLCYNMVEGKILGHFTNNQDNVWLSLRRALHWISVSSVISLNNSHLVSLSLHWNVGQYHVSPSLLPVTIIIVFLLMASPSIRCCYALVIISLSFCSWARSITVFHGRCWRYGKVSPTSSSLGRLFFFIDCYCCFFIYISILLGFDCWRLMSFLQSWDTMGLWPQCLLSSS